MTALPPLHQHQRSMGPVRWLRHRISGISTLCEAHKNASFPPSAEPKVAPEPLPVAGLQSHRCALWRRLRLLACSLWFWTLPKTGKYPLCWPRALESVRIRPNSQRTMVGRLGLHEKDRLSGVLLRMHQSLHCSQSAIREHQQTADCLHGAQQLDDSEHSQEESRSCKN